MAFAFSAGISPFILEAVFRRKDLSKLLNDGLKGEAKILGYEWRGAGKGRHIAIIFQFSPIDAPGPITYAKTIWGKMRLTPGSMVAVHYNAKFPMMSAIDAHGLKQNIESFAEPV